MQNLFFTQLSIPEVQQIFRNELENFFAEKSLNTKTEADEIGGIDLAVEITGKAKPTIYALVHKRKIPHSKQGKQLYFSRKELTDWLKSGKRKTQAELALDAGHFSTTNHKNKTTVAAR
jgi:excisionase family DNA binding protein